jgi:signal transduction histidine kinase
VTFGDVRRFSEDETLFLQGIADQAAIAIANARLHEQVRADQAQLQKLTHRLVELQESERRYVANELYNDEGQRLATLLLELGLLAREASGNSALMHRITGLRQLADGILSDMHGLAVNLRPASLDRLGLLAALRAHAEDLGRKSGIAVQVVVGEPQQVSLPPDTEAMVYRIAQEALNNAIRYSHASRLGIVATQHDGCLIVVVEDDGEGFDVAESGRSGGLGIVGMRERTQMLGGRLAIETSPGQGTAVYIEVPLPKD